MDREDRDLRAVVVKPSADEREATVARLSDAFAHDVLSLEEFEARVAGAYRATSKDGLAQLVKDLPAPVTAARPAADVRVIEVVPRRIVAIFGNVERDGPIEIPARLDIRSYFGNVELDLSAARFGPGVTDVSVRVFCGNVEVRLPANAVVENHGSGIFASFTCRASSDAHDGAADVVRLRVTGRAILGNVEIEAAAGSVPLLPEG